MVVAAGGTAETRRSAEARSHADEVLPVELVRSSYPELGSSFLQAVILPAVVEFPILFAFLKGPSMIGAMALFLEQFLVAGPFVCAATFVVDPPAKAHLVAEEVLVELIPSCAPLECSQAEVPSAILEVLAPSSGPTSVWALSVVGPIVWVPVFAVEQSAASLLVVKAVLPWPNLSSPLALGYSFLQVVIPTLSAFSLGPGVIGPVTLFLKQFPVFDPVLFVSAIDVRQPAEAHPAAEEVLVIEQIPSASSELGRSSVQVVIPLAVVSFLVVLAFSTCPAVMGV